MKKIIFLCLLGGMNWFLTGYNSVATAESFDQAPPQIQAALFVKLLAFHKGIAGKDIVIYVMGNPGISKELEKISGIAIGKGRLVKVVTGEGLPESRPSVVYVGSDTDLDKILDYTRTNDILSITGAPDLVSQGVTLGVGISNKKPRVLLNLTASKEEGVDWDYAILKVSITIN